jgi:hypothetical protein
MTDTTQPITKDELKSIQELEELTRDLEASEALYSAALDGLSGDIDRDIKELEEYNLDIKMVDAENDVAQMAANIIESDVDDVEKLEEELVQDDSDEDDALRDDEADPEEQGLQLESEGVTE